MEEKAFSKSVKNVPENIYREIEELLVIKEPEYNYNKTL